MLSTRDEPVSVWLDGTDLPTRLVHRGSRYRVVDQPTALPRTPEWPSGISHPPTDVRLSPGWRVTGRTDDGTLLVFDLRLAPNGWTVEATYA